jgi:hypothetical protein
MLLLPMKRGQLKSSLRKISVGVTLRSPTLLGWHLGSSSRRRMVIYALFRTIGRSTNGQCTMSTPSLILIKSLRPCTAAHSSLHWTFIGDTTTFRFNQRTNGRQHLRHPLACINQRWCSSVFRTLWPPSSTAWIMSSVVLWISTQGRSLCTWMTSSLPLVETWRNTST